MATFYPGWTRPVAIVAGLFGALTIISGGMALFGPTGAQQLAGDAVPFDLHITEREKSVLRLAATGLSNREIADALGLSEGTVKNYMSELMVKLESRDRTQAVIRAIAAGLL